MNTSTRLYDREFFQVLIAATLFMTGQGLQFHFGQYVAFLGHDVDVLGWLTGIAVVASLLSRPYLGMWIDRLGCRNIWLVGASVAAAVTFAMQFTENLWLLGTFRALAWMSVATVMSGVAVYATQKAPPERRAESLGIVGLGGFLGMVIGPTLGDLIFGDNVTGIGPYRLFFTLSAAAMFCGGMSISTVRSNHRATSMVRSGRAFLNILLHDCPWMALVVAVIFGMTFTINAVYLERYADARGFANIKLFFLAYAPTAMLLRVLFRTLPTSLGRERTLILGLLLMGTGVCSLIVVHQEWQLIIPGCIMGSGHCFVFPSMVDMATAKLPLETRGMGTSVILGAGDLGSLTGFIVNGQVIEAFGFASDFLMLGSLLAAASIPLVVKVLLSRGPIPKEGDRIAEFGFAGAVSAGSDGPSASELAGTNERFQSDEGLPEESQFVDGSASPCEAGRSGP